MQTGKRRIPVVVLVSGGMDSVVALYDAAQRHRVVGAVSFHYGSKHNDREIPFARYHCRRLGVPHRVIRLGFVKRLFKSDLLESGGPVPDGRYDEAVMKRTVVPFRNGLMLAAAAGYAESVGATGLVIGAHAGDHAIYPDCRPAFMKAMESALRLGTYARLRLLSPFIAETKARIVVRGCELGVDFGKTWSCYKGGSAHCGKCGTCTERREAFLLARVPDPTIYQGARRSPSRAAGTISTREK
jgi:7-cyano-7-deazaguanine synthase